MVVGVSIFLILIANIYSRLALGERDGGHPKCRSGKKYKKNYLVVPLQEIQEIKEIQEIQDIQEIQEIQKIKEIQEIQSKTRKITLLSHSAKSRGMVSFAWALS